MLRRAESYPARFRYFSIDDSSSGEELELTTLGVIHVPPGGEYPPSDHPEGYTYRWSDGRRLSEYQIHFITRGEGALETEAHGIEPIRISTGSVFVLFPHVWHRYAPATEQGWTEFWIGLRGAKVEQLIRNRLISEREPCPLLDDVHQVLTNFVRAVSTLDSTDVMAMEVRRASATLILAQLNSPQTKETGRSISRVEEAAQLLGETSSSGICMEELARRLNVGYHSLRQRFKEETGCTMSQLRNLIRLEQSAKLLRSHGIPIKEVARRCGFADQYYFSRAFRKHFGCSPRKYRDNDTI